MHSQAMTKLQMARAKRASGKRVRAARLAAGLRAVDLAWQCGVTPVTVWRWEHGRTIPGPADQARIDRAIARESAAHAREAGGVS
jgi:DNA-binding transcriptional regulator YiaG